MNNRRIIAVHAVTDSISAVLMRGQLADLRENGLQPALICSPGSESEQIGAQEGYPVFRIPMTREISPRRDLLSLFAVWRLLRRIKPLICNTGTPKAGLLVGLAAWLSRVPCRIYTLRGLRLETAKGIKRMILMVAERVACFCAHRVICVSSSLRERAIDLRLVQRGKTVLLGSGSSNGVNASRFTSTPERAALAAALRQKLGIGANQVVLGFVGRFTRDKGLPELIAAFHLIRKTYPEAVLLLVGDFEAGDPVSANIRKAINSDPAIHHIEFTHRVELCYLVMNVFVLPTHREGFPNTVLEAQAAGLPVVTTVATGAVDSILDGRTGLLTPIGDVHRLADAILSLLSEPARMQSMGKLGRERVLREFRNESVWEALASLYRTMLLERGYRFPNSCPEVEQWAQIR